MNKVLLVLTLLGIIAFSCSKGDNNKSYIEHFTKHRTEFDELVNYLTQKYDTPTVNDASVRIILINSNKQKKTFDKQTIDESILTAMDALSIDEIIFEKGKYDCDKNKAFEEIQFRFFELRSRPTIQYIFKVCNQDSIGFESKNITDYPINTHWSLLIDRNF